MNHGNPTIEQVVAGSRSGLKNVLRAADLPRAVTVPLPGNGLAVAGKATRWGTGVASIAALTGDGTKAQFVVTHNLGLTRGWLDARLHEAIAATSSLGAQHDGAIAPDIVDPANSALVMFPPSSVPAAGVSYYVVVIA
jgi:hypothetical protein